MRWEDKADLPQVTIRATIVGLIIGSMVLTSNFQFGLQTGWASMMSLPSALLGFTIFKFLPISKKFTDVENVYIQSVAVATGTGPLAYGLIGIIPAIENFLMPEETGLGRALKFSFWELVIWSLGLAFFGVFIAIPLRKQVIVKEKLPFPSGTATGILISVLHGNEPNNQNAEVDNGLQLAEEGSDNVENTVSHSEIQRIDGVESEDESTDESPLIGKSKEFHSNIKPLTVTFIISSFYTLVAYYAPILRNIPIFGATGKKYLWTFQPSPAYIGQGIIMGLPTVSYMLFGSVLGWGILSPMAKILGWAPGDIDDWKTGSQGWIMWISLSIMISDSIVAFFVVGAKSLKSLVAREDDYEADLNSFLELKDVDEKHLISKNATWCGLFASSLLCSICLKMIFGTLVPLYAIITGIILALSFSVLAVRALGETDLNPVSGIGKLSQLIFALIIPSRNPAKILINLIAGGIAEAGAQQAGDLMQDLKTGHLLGASPKAQFVAQMIGTIYSVFFSSLMYLFYKHVYNIPNEIFRIPTAVIWIDCARLVTGEGLPDKVPGFAIFFGFIFGCISLAKNLTPATSKYHSYLVYLPSGVAVGIGIYNTPNFTLARFIGGVISFFYLKKYPVNRVSLIILSSGLVLGEGLFSVVTMILASLGL
ncbi:putative oligopeptide transporter [[Candida] jaroonii]|uniref:Oligopeptide transporter n=1 Tax=[Candida] jaroonii TaxID=467808 RepID=A0ACA9Y7S4_9ASCO|nr:putative oligopeptide transporter [[Candida] jaroonii]